MSRSVRRIIAYALVITPTLLAACTAATEPAAPVVAPTLLPPFKQLIPTAAYSIEMVHVPGDAARGIAPFFMSTTEITWDAFDVFAYRLDERDVPEAQHADAATRPSKPYLPPDRGFGHEGFPAISMSFQGATAFCAWLSRTSGRRFRLPTEAEWEHACLAGSPGPYSSGDEPAHLPLHAWFAVNAGDVPHAVASLAPNAWGLFDMHGNVAEWVIGREGLPVLKGGKFDDPAAALAASARLADDPAWNASDPQVPKSRWWLADGPFVGFRVVCECQDSPQRHRDTEKRSASTRSSPSSSSSSSSSPPSSSCSFPVFQHK